MTDDDELIDELRDLGRHYSAAREGADRIAELKDEMQRRDEQWLELIAIAERETTWGLPLEQATVAELEAATDWITGTLQNLGLARHVIEQRKP